jgi:hypothetical protein
MPIPIVRQVCVTMICINGKILIIILFIYIYIYTSFEGNYICIDIFIKYCHHSHTFIYNLIKNGYMKEYFSIVYETLHVDGSRGEIENALNISAKGTRISLFCHVHFLICILLRFKEEKSHHYRYRQR